MSGSVDPSITVVVPTYNRGDLLPQTLDSVFAQTLKPTEVIVVDDGSTDDTAQYLATVAVTCIRNPDGGWGPGRARNEGFKSVSTDLIAFLDSDDLLLPGALRQLAAPLVADETAPFAFGRAFSAMQDEQGWHPTGLMTAEAGDLASPLTSLFARNFVPSTGTVLRTAALREIGGYPMSARWVEDHYLWIRLAQIGDPVFVPSITAVYRVHPGNRLTAGRAGTDLNQFLLLGDEDPRLKAVEAEYLGVSLCENLTPSLRSGDGRAALMSIRDHLLGRPEKLRIISRAASHWRARRRWRDAGLRIWEEDDALRDWLGER